jgi:hypothetical protein
MTRPICNGAGPKAAQVARCQHVFEGAAARNAYTGAQLGDSNHTDVGGI